MADENYGQAGANPVVPQPESQPSQAQPVGYGFADDKPQSEQLEFGLNSGTVKMIKYEYLVDEKVPDGYANIVFKIGEREMSARVFPVTKAFVNKEEVTNPTHPEFQKAVKLTNAHIIHIIKAFVPEDDIRVALSSPISSFEQFINATRALLPANFPDIKLDIFLQYEWQIREDNDRTWLRVPKNVKHGHWLSGHIAPIDGNWKPVIEAGRLSYQDGANNEHPFVRGKWFMESNFAKMQKQDSVDDLAGDAPATETTGW